jgi:hypothetical protein
LRRSDPKRIWRLSAAVLSVASGKT